ncbi:MAG: hypothetical protein ACLR4Z_03255 [Butyricicoccaceae bacterium]
MDESILDLIPKGAERICVGKKMGHHPVPQDEINALLVRLARQESAPSASRAATAICLGAAVRSVNI